MGDIVLECAFANCKLGTGETVWKTPSLLANAAISLLESHRDNHKQVPGARGGGDGGGGGGDSKNMKRLDRPRLEPNSNQQDFSVFKKRWEICCDSSGQQTDKTLRNQLLTCAEDTLQKTLFSTLGERWETISSADLLKEMGEMAVEKQSEMLNEVRLIEAKQERDEAVRKFLARLKGLANICDLTVNCSHNPSVTVSYANKSIHTALVRGLYDTETKGELLSKVEKLSLDDTVAFVEARETGKRSLAGLSGTLAGQTVNAVKDYSKLKCWRCGENGHRGDSQLHVKKKYCKAFNTKCTACNNTGHYTKFCKQKAGDKEEKVKTHSVVGICSTADMRLHSAMMTYRLGTRSKQEKLRSIELSNEEFDKFQEKFIDRLAAMPPTVKVTIRVDCDAYYKHVPRLECMMLDSFMKKMESSTEAILPYQFRPTADTGAQATVIGDEHLERIGLDISSLHHSKVTMDCANNMVLKTLGVFFGYIRGKSVLTGETFLHRGMVYVVKGSIMLLSETALRDLGIIPDTFPQIGQFGGNVESDDGVCRFDTNGIYPITPATAICQGGGEG